jgi:hypothetical protein
MSDGQNLTRCPWCDLLLFQDGECGDCGYTGTCPYCDNDVEVGNEYPQFHLMCAFELRLEEAADRKR